MNFIMGEDALFEDEGMSVPKLLLDLRAPVPPPADHIHDVAIFGEYLQPRRGSTTHLGRG